MFESLGYFKEYWIGNKYIGSIRCEKDRDDVGYTSRKSEVAHEKIILDNKRVIKAGREVITILYPLCGSEQK